MEVLISTRALEWMEREVRKRPDVETGGIIVGLCRGEKVIVTHATGPGPQALHSANYFIKDTAYLQRVLNLLFQYYGANYLGVWHKHPPELEHPSDGDIASAQDELNDSQVGLPYHLLPVCTLRDGEFRLLLYVIRDRVYERIEWQPVDHSQLLTPDLVGRQWYDTSLGQSRLAQELELLRTAGPAEVRKAKDGSYSFWVSVSPISTQKMVLGCPPDYPAFPPEVAIYNPEKESFSPSTPLRLVHWTMDSYLIDLWREVVTGSAK